MGTLRGTHKIAALEQERVFVAAFADAVFDLERPALFQDALDFLAIFGAVVGVDQQNPLLETPEKFVRKNSKDRLGSSAVERLVGRGVPLAENQPRGFHRAFHAESGLAEGAHFGIQGGHFVRAGRLLGRLIGIQFFHA